MAQNWLYNRFNAFLERYMPEGLFPRALIILVAPVVLLQTIMTGLILGLVVSSAKSTLSAPSPTRFQRDALAMRFFLSGPAG